MPTDVYRAKECRDIIQTLKPRAHKVAGAHHRRWKRSQHSLFEDSH